MTGLRLDRSVVRNDICYDCTETCDSAFDVNGAGLQSPAIESGRTAGWDRQSRNLDVERGGLQGAVERAVVDYPRDRPAGVVAEIGRVAAGRGVLNRIERRLPLRQRRC